MRLNKTSGVNYDPTKSMICYRVWKKFQEWSTRTLNWGKCMFPIEAKFGRYKR